MASDDDLLPKKKTTSTAKPVKSSASASSDSGGFAGKVRLYTRLAGLLLGGVVALVGMMSVVGIVTDNVWARLVVALVIVVGFPAFVSDRILKRTGARGGIARVVDIYAICLLAMALLLVAAQFASKPLFVSEGDRYARSGTRVMARLAYFLGGVSPVFPEEKGTPPATSASSSAAAPDAGAAR